MAEVIARIKVNGKNFEILVDVDKALAFKKDESSGIDGVIAIDKIFTDSKKGLHASESDLKDAFKTTDVNEIAKKIVISGEVQVPTEYKEKQREGKVKQVIDFFVKNAVDPKTDRPYTADRIEQALSEAGVNISSKPIDAQIKSILEKLTLVLPIKIETKRLIITIPSQYSGQAYGILQSYKESEEWLGNGDLKCIVNVPVGLQMEFYDKINSITHGSALSEELSGEASEKKDE